MAASSSSAAAAVAPAAVTVVPLHTHYRECTLGVTLSRTLEVLVQNGTLTKPQAAHVVSAYDSSFNKRITNVANTCAKFKFSGSLSEYRNVNDEWEFTITNIMMKTQTQSTLPAQIDTIKVVAQQNTDPASSIVAGTKKRKTAKS